MNTNGVDWIDFVKLLASKLQKYTDQKKVNSILMKLRVVPMTLEILKVTKVGKIVNEVRKKFQDQDANIGLLGKELIAEWKLIAAHENNVYIRHESTNENKQQDFKENLINAFDQNTNLILHNTQVKTDIKVATETQGNLNDTEFKQYEQHSIDYNNISEDFYLQKSKSRTQVYSGRKHKCLGNISSLNSFNTNPVPSLYDSCIRVLIENIDFIEFIGPASADMIAPILMKCNPSQLFNLEHHNPKLLDETDCYWEKHSAREFKPNYAKRKAYLDRPLNPDQRYEEDLEDEFDSWREFYLAQLDARELKLKKITANISATIKKSDPGPRVKLAFMSGTAKPPRNVIRKQLQNKIRINSNKLNAAPSVIRQNVNSNPFSTISSFNSSTCSSFAGSNYRINNLEIDTEKYVVPKGIASSSLKRSTPAAPMMEKTMKLFKRCKLRR